MKHQAKPRFIYLSDLLVIASLFAKEKKQLYIFDPNHILVQNVHQPVRVFSALENLQSHCNGGEAILSLAHQSILEQWPEVKFHVLIDFANLSKSSPWGAKNNTTHAQQSFLYFPNPDGTMRCFAPYRNPIPSFLSLYNGSGWRGWLYRNYYRWAYRLGMKSLVSQGKFVLYANEEWPLSELGFEENETNFSVFTGTAGENRKLIIERNEKGKTTHFIKRPISNKSFHLVGNEHRMIKELRKKDWRYWVLPTVCSRGDSLLLSNVKPAKSTNAIDLQAIHYKALSELYLSNVSNNESAPQRKTLASLNVFHFIGRQLGLMHGLDFTDSTLDRQVVNRLVTRLDTLFHHLSIEQEIPVSFAHCDFTPWNQFVTPEKIYVYDWELAQAEMPILYDAFHYIFQSTTLIQQSDFSAIQEKVNALKCSTFSESLKTQIEFDFDWHWKFYLLYTASYYLPIYLRQSDLFPQAHWLVRNWCDGLWAIEERVFELRMEN